MLLAYHNQTWFWSPYCPTVGNGDASIIPSSTFIIAIDNGPFIVDVAIEMVIFHSYVSLPEGTHLRIIWEWFTIALPIL
jgi:hypothetical protein